MAGIELDLRFEGMTNHEFAYRQEVSVLFGLMHQKQIQSLSVRPPSFSFHLTISKEYARDFNKLHATLMAAGLDTNSIDNIITSAKELNEAEQDDDLYYNKLLTSISTAQCSAPSSVMRASSCSDPQVLDQFPALSVVYESVNGGPRMNNTNDMNPLALGSVYSQHPISTTILESEPLDFSWQ